MIDVEKAMGVLNMKRSKRITIKHVAQEAGVSTQTVSRVLNERPDVAPDTRQRVKDVIEELGYQPSALARSLIHQRSYTLGVVTSGLKFIGPSRTLNGITGQAEEMGYTLLLKELSGFETKDAKPILNSLIARQVDGIIWAVPEVGDNRDWVREKLPALNIPILFLTMEPRDELSIVSFDNYLGGRIATEHLLEQGFRKIAHVSGPLDWWESRQRKAGWVDALREAGIQASEDHCAEGTWSCASGERAIYTLLEKYPDMDAIFSANDQIALGVIKVACQEGIHIPDDLALVGFDGIPEAAYFWPPLTTVYQDQHAMGSLAVEKLVQSIEMFRQGKGQVEPNVSWLKPELLIRQSSVRR
jgi:LacI family transcriptional regulator